MPIYTPRGLKVRLSIPFAFALLARLYPRVDAFRVLRTTEGIESIPSAFALCVAMMSFAAQAQPLMTGALVFVAYLVGALLTLRGMFIVPGMVGLGTLYNNFAGYGIFFAAIIVAGYLNAGIWGPIAYFSARIAGFFAEQILEFSDVKTTWNATGATVTSSEKHFINAYRLHASRIGETLDVSVEDVELEESNWVPVLTDLAVKWPEVARRITPD